MIEQFIGFVGHDHVVESAYSHFKHGRSVLFYGPVGSGKSSLIAASAVVMSERKVQSLPMVIGFCNPMKQFLLTILEKLYRRKLLERELLATDWDALLKKFNREHYRVVFKVIVTSFRTYPGIFIGIDDLDTLTPVGRSIVLELSNAGAIICASASKRTPTLQRVLYQFQVVDIPPINDNYIRKLATAFLDHRGLLVEDRQHFVENIVWKVAGNPLALDNAVRFFENEPVIRVDDVRKIGENASRKETSLEWIIYAGFAFIILLRFVSRATMNKQLYIITSVFVALFVLLRYFLMKGNRRD